MLSMGNTAHGHYCPIVRLASTQHTANTDPNADTAQFARTAGTLTLNSDSVQDIQVTVGGSPDLTTFARPGEATVHNASLPSAPSGYEWQTFRLSEPISSRSRGFPRASFIHP
jgi:hypothetical protein